MEQPAAANACGRRAGCRPRSLDGCLPSIRYGADHPVTITFDRQFQAVLNQQAGGETVHYAEYLETGRFPGESQARIMRDYLRQKYADRKIDVLFCWGVGPLEFLLRHHDELFPGTPIVYYVSSLEAVKHLPAPPLTGVLNPDAYERTLELALSLHPDTTEVFFVSGTANHDKSIEREGVATVRKVSEQGQAHLPDRPPARSAARNREEPPQTIDHLLLAASTRGSCAGCCSRSISWTRSRARPPFPSTRPGDRISAPEPSEASSTIRWLAPRKPRRLSCVSPGALVPRTFPPIAYPRSRPSTRASWPVGASARPGSPPAASSSFGNPRSGLDTGLYIIGTGVVLAIQTLLIAGLLVQRARRRRVEAALRESEERFRLMADTAPVMIWRANVDKKLRLFQPPVARVPRPLPGAGGRVRLDQGCPSGGPRRGPGDLHVGIRRTSSRSTWSIGCNERTASIAG